jgi:hypothetical protein
MCLSGESPSWLKQMRQHGTELSFRSSGIIGAVCFVVALGSSWSAAATEIIVPPTSDLAELVRDAPPSSTFVLLPGKHYSGEIQPKDGQTFKGKSGAILSGAVSIGPFTRSGDHWKAAGPVPLAPSHGTCHRMLAAGPGACLLREALFANDAPLKRVLDVAQLDAGAWYQDRTTGEVDLGFEPGDKLIEMSYRPAAFYGPARDVVIRGLVIQHYASPAQNGAIQAFDPAGRTMSSGWVVEDNEIRFNSGAGIRTGNRMLVRSNRVYANGQIGITGMGDGLVIEFNDITDNNTHGFAPSWESGGTKFVETTNLLFQRNCVRDNDGPGIWMDINNRNSMIMGNWSIRNTGVGIFNEISGRAIIVDNLSALNGSSQSPWDSQILVSGSIDTLVVQNRVQVAPRYGNGIFIVEEGRANSAKIIHDFPDYVSQNNVVMKNQIVFDGALGVSGFAGPVRNGPTLASRNVFEDNEIIATEAESRRFRIGDELLNIAGAQVRGQELRSKIELRDTSDLVSTNPTCTEANRGTL